MQDEDKTKELLINELKKMRLRVAELEKSETEDVDTEIELRGSEELYRTLIETSPDPIVMYSLSGEILTANAQAAKVYGVSSVDELLKEVKTVFDLLTEEGKLIAKANFSRILSEGRSQKNEYQMQIRNGTSIPTEINSSVVQAVTGEPRAIISVIRDITERKHTENKLTETLQRLRFHMENTPLAIVEFNKFFQITYWSKQAEKIFGWNANEVMGKRIDQLRWVHEEDVQRVTELSADMLASRRTSNIHINRNYRKDGSIIICEWCNSALVDAEGELISVYSLVLDITEQKRMEEELLRAQKIESIGILAGGIAHDFNNLLASIMGYIELAKECAQPGNDVYRILEKAEISCNQASELTKRLITFSKGGAPLRKDMSLAVLLKDLCYFTFNGSNVRYELSTPEDLWHVFADEGQLRHVVHHLLKNAIEAMPEGGVVTVRAINRTVTEDGNLPLNNGKYVAWSVKDHGIGIPKENLSRIFDPYFTTKDRGSTKGMGLGLAICYSVIKQHDGLITVVSEQRSGTTFTVYLPAVVSEEISDEITEFDTARRDTSDGVTGSKGSILVMDDDELIRDLMKVLLNRLGFNVEVASNGDEAIALYKKAKESDQPFKMTILDVTVRGGMGGEFTIKKLIQIDPHVKAIAISGYTDDPVINNYWRYGFLGALTKPFKKDELHAILKKIYK